MKVLRAILSGIGDAMTPDGTMVKNRMRIRLDTLLSLAATVVALALTVGYQVLSRWGYRFFGEDE